MKDFSKKRGSLEDILSKWFENLISREKEAREFSYSL